MTADVARRWLMALEALRARGDHGEAVHLVTRSADGEHVEGQCCACDEVWGLVDAQGQLWGCVLGDGERTGEGDGLLVCPACAGLMRASLPRR